jgi:hypothetical protein
VRSHAPARIDERDAAAVVAEQGMQSGRGWW